MDLQLISERGGLNFGGCRSSYTDTYLQGTVDANVRNVGMAMC
jgi:hypothetical protein